MRWQLCLTAAVCSAALVLCSASDREWPVREQETIQKTLSATGSPLRLVVDNVFGFVHIVAATGPQIRLTAHKLIRAETGDDLAQAKSEVSLETSEKPGSTEIYYQAPWRCGEGSHGCHGDHRRFYEVTYDIDVEAPRDARIVASTVNGGDIRVTGMAGDFEVSNVNGSIAMNRVSGSGNAHTVNGPITVHFAKNPVRDTTLKTVNGQLDAYFQPGLSANLLFKTFNGEILSDFNVTPRPVSTPISERHGGKFVYHSDGPVAARTGGGGPEISFDSLNGDIRLHGQGHEPND